MGGHARVTQILTLPYIPAPAYVLSQSMTALVPAPHPTDVTLHITGQLAEGRLQTLYGPAGKQPCPWVTMFLEGVQQCSNVPFASSAVQTLP